MGKLKDLTGLRFGRLTVIELDHKEQCKSGTRIYWRCRCDCGKITVVKGYSLTSGVTRSCGCLHRQEVSERCLQDLTGLKFGRLTVIERAPSKGKDTRWRCKCDCGNEVVVRGNDLKRGATQSCGCLHRGGNHKTHGMTNTNIYRTWKGIKDRCFKPNSTSYKNYGGRGITMFPAWIEDFQAFYDYVSKLPHFGEVGYSLDRINNDGDYEPGNVRWADQKTQNRNTRRNHIVEYQGQKMTLTEAAEKSKISVQSLRGRIQRGETGEMLFRPVRK